MAGQRKEVCQVRQEEALRDHWQSCQVCDIDHANHFYEHRDDRAQ